MNYALTGMLLWIAAFIALAVGWVMNIVTIAHIMAEPITGMFVLRVVGIFVAPLGGVLGYI